MGIYVIASDKKSREVAYIDQYPFGCVYQPKVEFSVWLEEGNGFHVEMICHEKNPKAVYENHGDPVYKDSCLEYFVDFFPSDKVTGYLNFEMNAKGAMLLQYGKNKYDRVSVLDKLDKKQTSVIKTDCWSVVLFMPLDFIAEIYGKKDFDAGHIIHANAYKCGDDTASRHYGCWNKVTHSKPNFHVPECFGEMMIGVKKKT